MRINRKNEILTTFLILCINVISFSQNVNVGFADFSCKQNLVLSKIVNDSTLTIDTLSFNNDSIVLKDDTYFKFSFSSEKNDLSTAESLLVDSISNRVIDLVRNNANINPKKLSIYSINLILFVDNEGFINGVYKSGFPYTDKELYLFEQHLMQELFLELSKFRFDLTNELYFYFAR